jgi:hypothetical protein
MIEEVWKRLDPQFNESAKNCTWAELCQGVVGLSSHDTYLISPEVRASPGRIRFKGGDLVDELLDLSIERHGFGTLRTWTLAEQK